MFRTFTFTLSTGMRDPRSIAPISVTPVVMDTFQCKQTADASADLINCIKDLRLVYGPTVTIMNIRYEPECVTEFEED